MGIVGCTTDGAFPLMGNMNDVFALSWGRDMEMLEKSKGTGDVGLNTTAAFNAIYGPYIQNLAYNQHNTLAVLGQKEYKTGRRYQADLSLSASASSGVVRGGFAPQPTYGVYETIEMPYKVLAKRQAMNLGYTDLGEKGIDDVLTWEDFFAQEGKTWLYSMNADVLRPVESARIVGQGSKVDGGIDSSAPNAGEYVGYESIDRIISNIDEGEYVDGNSATNVNNVPWAVATQLPSTDRQSPMAKYRNPDATGATTSGSNFDCYVDHNYTTGNTDGTHTNRQLDLAMIDSLFMSCMPYWNNNSTAGKVLVTRYDTLQHIQTLLQPQQRYQGFVSAQVDVNGISTVQGQNTGFQVATYNGVPLVPDLMVAGDGAGDIFLMDNEIIYNGMIQAPTVNISENPIITGRYTRLCDMFQIGEIQVNGMFKGLGKIKHIA